MTSPARATREEVVTDPGTFAEIAKAVGPFMPFLTGLIGLAAGAFATHKKSKSSLQEIANKTIETALTEQKTQREIMLGELDVLKRKIAEQEVALDEERRARRRAEDDLAQLRAIIVADLGEVSSYLKSARNHLDDAKTLDRAGENQRARFFKERLDSDLSLTAATVEGVRQRLAARDDDQRDTQKFQAVEGSKG